MVAKTQSATQQALPPNSLEIRFVIENSTVLAKPPAPRVRAGQTVVFVNETPGRVTIFMASDNVLKDLKKIQPRRVEKKNEATNITGRSAKLKVTGDPGEYEYAVHYGFIDPKTKKSLEGFAIGKSSPRIVIIKPSSAVQISTASAKKP